MIKAQCTWGEGPDIMLTLEGKGFILYEKPKRIAGQPISDEDASKGQWLHGCVENGSMDLTVDEARQLATDLLKAVQAVRKIEKSYEEYCAKGGKE